LPRKGEKGGGERERGGGERERAREREVFVLRRRLQPERLSRSLEEERDHPYRDHHHERTDIHEDGGPQGQHPRER